jgi:uncharacterized protein
MNFLGILLLTLLPGVNVQDPAAFDHQLERFTRLAMEGKTQEAIAYLRVPGFLRAVDPEGHTALFAAAVACNSAVLDQVLTRRPDLDHRDKHGATALFYAASQGRVEVVRRLVQAGAMVDVADTDGKTPLMAAVMMNHADVTHVLLAAHALVNVQDRYGSTALIEAVDGGHYDIAALLLGGGANASLARSDGTTAMQVARSRSMPKIVELLRHEEDATSD